MHLKLTEYVLLRFTKVAHSEPSESRLPPPPPPPAATPKPMRIRVPTPETTTRRATTKKPRYTTAEPEYPDPDIDLAPAPPRKNTNVGGVDLGSLAKSFMGGGAGQGLVGQFLGSGLSGGPAPTSSSIPSGYGGASLGGAGAGTGPSAGGSGGGQGGNFISLIANTVKELGDKKAQGRHGGANVAKVAQQWLNPNQFGSLFSGLWVLVLDYRKIALYCFLTLSKPLNLKKNIRN